LQDDEPVNRFQTFAILSDCTKKKKKKKKNTGLINSKTLATKRVVKRNKRARKMDEEKCMLAAKLIGLSFSHSCETGTVAQAGQT
jgi:hypothetical protein